MLGIIGDRAEQVSKAQGTVLYGPPFALLRKNSKDSSAPAAPSPSKSRYFYIANRRSGGSPERKLYECDQIAKAIWDMSHVRHRRG